MMFEHRHQAPLSRKEFAFRLLKCLTTVAYLVAVSMVIGLLGYHHFEQMNWLDAFENAAMILSGMGPVDGMKTDAGKIFAGCYALYSGLLLIAAMGILLTPVLHRMMHKFHMPKD